MGYDSYQYCYHWPLSTHHLIYRCGEVSKITVKIFSNEPAEMGEVFLGYAWSWNTLAWEPPYAVRMALKKTKKKKKKEYLGQNHRILKPIKTKYNNKPVSSFDQHQNFP